jgi:hypothetical protein
MISSIWLVWALLVSLFALSWAIRLAMQRRRARRTAPASRSTAHYHEASPSKAKAEPPLRPAKVDMYLPAPPPEPKLLVPIGEPARRRRRAPADDGWGAGATLKLLALATKIGVTGAIMLFTLPTIASPYSDPQLKNMAYGLLGAVVGHWLSPGAMTID